MILGKDLCENWINASCNYFTYTKNSYTIRCMFRKHCNSFVIHSKLLAPQETESSPLWHA